MKNQTHHTLVLVLILSLFPNSGSPFFPSKSHADLSTYVVKYKDATVSGVELEKLSRYDFLIDYFCSFSYFRPRYKVSPDFIKALILAESGCNRYAVSYKEALGLGQILHATGEIAAREIYESGKYYQYIDRKRLKNLKKEDLFDPAINILLTCYLIAKYNFRYEGRLELVLSAWNAGENIESLKSGEPAPYIETHDLIGKINGYYLFLLKRKQQS